MKKLVFGILVSLSCIGVAYGDGGGSSVGGGICQHAEAICSSPNEETAVCVFDQFAIVDTGGHARYFRNIRLQPVPPHTLGAPEIFTGSDFKLTVIVDAAERPGYLTIPSLGLENYPLSCKEN
jgi:hypothetical protein